MSLRSSLLVMLLAATALAGLPTATANHDQPIACVGDEGPELPGVCYDYDDYDDCDIYAGLGGGNQVCVVPSMNTCSSQAPEWPGVCWAPREECQLWFGLGRVYCLLPVSASTTSTASTTAADPWPACQLIVEGPDVRFGVCVDPTNPSCTAWTFTYGGQTCYVPGVAQASASAEAAPNFCHEEILGPDVKLGVCVSTTDPDCYLWTYDYYNEDCHLPRFITTSAGAVPDPYCQQLFFGPDVNQGICYDLSRDTCQVWYYRTYQGPRETCLT